MARAVLDFVFPPLCPGCGEYLEGEHPICGTCRGRFDTYELPFCIRCRLQISIWPECPSCRCSLLPLFAYGNYVDPLKQVILEMKFRGMLDSIPALVDGLTETFGERIASRQADCLVPIPLHPAREYARGYNQALEIASALSCRLELPVQRGLLYRHAKRKPQQTLPAARRATNIRGVFDAAGSDLEGARVLLVDDIVTSGETAMEASRVLEAAGHRVVGVIALAHGL